MPKRLIRGLATKRDKLGHETGIGIGELRVLGSRPKLEIREGRKR